MNYEAQRENHTPFTTLFAYKYLNSGQYSILF